MSSDRRDFLGTLLAAGVVPILGGTAQGRKGATSDPSALAPSRLSDSPWDVTWADKLTGKHKAVFDNIELSMGLGLLRSLVWMKDYGEVYNVPASDMNAVVVIRHDAIWAIMDNEFWKMHKLGEQTKMTDPATKAPVARNPFIGPNLIGLPAAMADDTLKKLLDTATVLACNLAFTLYVVEKVKADTKMDDAKAREHALAHVLPGVKLQPSGVFAALRAQEAGCHYLLATEA